MTRRYGYPLSLVGLTAVLIGFAFHADASIIVFNSRESWESALSGSVFEQYNFNAFAADTPIANDPNFGSFTLTTLGTPPDGANFINVGPFDDVSEFSLDGSPYASLFVDGTSSVALAFAAPQRAFGGEFFTGGSPWNFGVFSLGNRGVQFVEGASTNHQFFGFLSTEAFNRIEFRYSGPPNGSSTISVDNVQFSAVPEPASLLLLGMGATFLGGYGAWRLRRGEPKDGRDRT